MVETRLDEVRLLGLVKLLLAGGEVGSALLEAGLLLLLGLALVFLGEPEEGGRRVAVEDVAELGDRRRGLQALVEDDLLALETDVFRPLDKAGEVGLVADRLACRREAQGARWSAPHSPVPDTSTRRTDAERLGASLEERVRGLLAGLGRAGSLGNLLLGGLQEREGEVSGSPDNGDGEGWLTCRLR